MFSFVSNDYQRLPATPRNMLVTRLRAYAASTVASSSSAAAAAPWALERADLPVLDIEGSKAPS
jgi:hypothetical protein